MSFAGLPLKLSRESRVLSPVNCFPPDVLEANRRGELTDQQRKGFTAMAHSAQRNALSSAAFLVASALRMRFAPAGRGCCRNVEQQADGRDILMRREGENDCSEGDRMTFMRES